MEKNMNKVEKIEINEEVKVEELTEETLDEANGGFDPFTAALAAYAIAQFAGVAKKWLGC